MSHLNDRIDKIPDTTKCMMDIIEQANLQKWIKYDGSTELSILYTTYVVNCDILWEVEKLHDLVNDLVDYKIRIVDRIIRFSNYMQFDGLGNYIQTHHVKESDEHL